MVVSFYRRDRYMIKNKSSIAAYIITGILALAFVLMLAAFIFLPLFNLLALLLLDAVFLIILIVNLAKKKHKAAKVCSIVFICVFTAYALFASMFTMPVSVNTRWQYPVAMKYSHKPGYKDDFFPEKIPDSAKNIHFDFLPSFLQGTGHACLSFTADEEYVSELKARLEKEAKHAVKYNDIGELVKTLPKEKSDYGGQKVISMYTGDFINEHPDSMAYVIKTNYNWNHPRNQVVLIDGNDVLFTEQ